MKRIIAATIAATAFGVFCGCFCFVSASAEASSHDEIQKSYRRGAWYICETKDFQVMGRESFAASRAMAKRCEELRRDLHAKWLGDFPHRAWSPKCQVIVHSSTAAYVRTVGRGSELTVGASVVEKRGNATVRRIDLRGDGADCFTAALPHELTHVVVADRFVGRAMPRWSDEGMAVLADPADKQSLHADDLRDGLARRETFPLPELANISNYPPEDRWGVFYGQSVSMVQFLVERKGSTEFVDFVELAMNRGYDSALRSIYGIQSLGELDRQWRASASAALSKSGANAKKVSLSANDRDVELASSGG